MGYGTGGYGDPQGAGTFTVQDIITRVQRSFGDESAVQVTTDDILRWITDACREVVMQDENLLQTSADIDSVVGQSLYSPPSNCFTIDSILFRSSDDLASSYYSLRYLNTVQMNQFADGWRGNTLGNGTPQVFTRADDGQFAIFPAPDVARTGAIKVVYSRYSNDIVDLNSTIDLPPYYHSYVEHFCMMKAYEMDEDWESADRKAQLVQSTIDFNNTRPAWFGRESYPTISTSPEDY